MNPKELEVILKSIQEIPDCDSLKEFQAAIMGELEQALLAMDGRIALLANLTNPLTLIATLIQMFTQELNQVKDERFQTALDLEAIVRAIVNKAKTINCHL